MKVQGKDLIVTVNDIAIAGSKSCDVDITQSLIEVCSPVSGRASDYVPEKVSWTIQTNHLIPNINEVSDLLDVLQDGTRVSIVFFDKTLEMYREGEAYVTNIHISGAIGSLATYSISLQGCGLLTEIRRLSFDGDPLLMERVIEKSQAGDILLRAFNEVDLLYCNFTLTKAMRLVVTRSQYPALPWILLTGNIDLYKQGIHDLAGQITDLMDERKVAFEMQSASVNLQPGNYVLIKNSEGGSVSAELRKVNL